MADVKRKPYHKPILEEMGDLRTLTLGGSPGYGDLGGDYGYHKSFGASVIPRFPPLGIPPPTPKP